MARRPTLTTAAAIVAASSGTIDPEAAADIVDPRALNGKPGQTVFGDAMNLLDTKSVDNVAMSPYWQLVSDIIDGAEAMRARHSVYLPKFPNENAADYAFRWKNSKFTNIYRDVLENLASKPFAQEVSLIEPDESNPKVPEEIRKFIEDVDGSGSHMTVFAADTFFNGINSAIDWIWVDYEKSKDDMVRTIQDEKALGLRPFWTHVLGANMLDVRSRVINGKERLTYVRLQENEPEGKYIRIMRSDGEIAAWELYREVLMPSGNKAPTRFAFVDTGPITIGEIPMVPFVTGRRKGRTWQFLPMMKDAAELQVELYQQESGLKNVEALAGFPMLAGNGVNPPTTGAGKNAKPDTLATGPQTVLYAPPHAGGTSAGSWSFIAPPAEILRFLLDHIKETINQLRELGRNPLTAQSGNLTVVTAATAAKKGNSAVQMWAFGLKDALENALVLTGKWMNIPTDKYDPEVNVFTDFEIDGQQTDVANLIEMRKNREISLETFWREMQRRGVLSGEFDAKSETVALLDAMITDEGTEDGLTPPADPANDPAR